ncbi:MAG: glycosyltransferase [Saprospiraceae bacterium]
MNKTIFNIEEGIMKALAPNVISKNGRFHPVNPLPEILFLSSYPPRECGIATYSQDLLSALDNKFSDSFSLKVCALESGKANHVYPDEVKYILDTNDVNSYKALSHSINTDKQLELLLVQHEFGLFENGGEDAFLQFLYGLTKPVVLVFHTVLPNPGESLKANVRHIAVACKSIVVMTKNAALILSNDYGVPSTKISVIPHGTHLVPHLNKEFLKNKYEISGRKILSTFGLLSSGKSIETTLDALPAIVEINPDVLFLVIGKTHPGVVKSEGEKYRTMLEEKVDTLNLRQHVKFINRYLPLQDLLEYLQLTDIYLFTSKDPNQAVSGTFSYAMSCGCPVISTPIPHAREVLREDTGIIIDFQNSQQLADGVNRLMSDESLRLDFSTSTLQRIVPTAWENAAIAHALLLQKIAGDAPGESDYTELNGAVLQPTRQPDKRISLNYRLPAINLDHVKKMTTDFGMIQFSNINQPDLDSGYTLDDNARALIAVVMHYQLTGDALDLPFIKIYVDFIKFCQQPNGQFLNYADCDKKFTTQNEETNLADSNGRAIWSLGYLVSKRAILPGEFIKTAEDVLEGFLPNVNKMHSTRAMAFVLKGLYYYNLEKKSPENVLIIKMLANRLVQMYRHESEQDWQWFESYLTYGNSILPEAILCAWLATGDPVYKEITKTSFDFLLSLTFKNDTIKVISNRSWLQKGKKAAEHGEQPIDVAYTILALRKFYDVFLDESYARKLATAFSWFLGNNHLHQIIYNPCTGGCYDGLEESHVNLNQGAESTLSYLMARLIVN